MITIEVDATKIQARLTSMPARVHEALVREVGGLRLKLEAFVKSNKLSGGVLNVRTGALRRSIFSETIDAPTSVIGKVASSGDVKYAAIHEFGGVTPAHDIFPVKAQALAFLMGGNQVFAKVVHHPGSKIPERSFMRSSLADMRGAIESGLREAVTGAVRD